MDQLLIELLDTLTEIEERGEDLTATDVREDMFEYIWKAFLIQVDEPPLPKLHLEDPAEEENVLAALQNYVRQAVPRAKELELNFKQRLTAFQGPDVETDSGMTSDEFFGWIDPDDYDENGEPVS